MSNVEGYGISHCNGALNFSKCDGLRFFQFEWTFDPSAELFGQYVFLFHLSLRYFFGELQLKV